ncbi:hypothetical protein RintRC_4797 [Richelia intracellularis]|nr:hypothetical protein RintRC_4797 [Richelia intracellularis]
MLMQRESYGIVLVTRAYYTQENILRETIDDLIESDLGLLGGVINATDIEVPSSSLNGKTTKNTEVNVGQELSSDVSSPVGNNYN